MEKLWTQVTTILGDLLTAIGSMLLVAVSDWRTWFALLGAMAVVHFTKQFIVHKHDPRRPLIVRIVSFVAGFLLALYAFRGYEHVIEISLSIGFVVPFIYLLGRWLVRVVVPTKYRPKVVERAFSSDDEQYDGRTIIPKREM